MAKGIYQAHEQYQWRTDPETGARYEVVSKTPGMVHAYEVQTSRGDPWRSAGGQPLSHTDPHFFDGLGPQAACGHRVKVALYALFDAKDAAACHRCAARLEAGPVRPAGPVPRERQEEYRTVCGDAIDRTVNGETFHYQCVELAGHGGKPHRDQMGSTWELGAEDFKPWILQRE
jgi:hypothetical protein